MKNVNFIVKLAMTTLFSLTAATSFADHSKAAKTDDMEKCYGIVKKGMNDCQTKTDSCAGSAKVDNQPDAFLFLPKGDCNKIVGGSLKPKSEDKSK